MSKQVANRSRAGMAHGPIVAWTRGSFAVFAAQEDRERDFAKRWANPLPATCGERGLGGLTAGCRRRRGAAASGRG